MLISVINSSICDQATSKGAINYIDTNHQTLYCVIADKPECNINFGSYCVYLPYLNTTQISVLRFLWQKHDEHDH